MSKTIEESGARQRIAETAIQLFKQYGTRSITMDSIAEKLHVSKRTIYENYRDKNELLSVCIRELVELEKAVRQRLQDESEDIIEGIIRIMYHGIDQMRSINPLFFLELERYYPAVWGIIDRFHNDYLFKETVRQINLGMKQRLFRSDVNVDMAARLFRSEFKVLKDDRFAQSDAYSTAEFIQNLVVNFLRGISTQRGRELVDVYLKRHENRQEKYQ
jgi:TetR/AcrR family transcriptional regulator, cholesterol catabolism regulator